MNSNLKKLFGFATIAACSFGFAMNAKAAGMLGTDYTVASGVCTATTWEGVESCSKESGLTGITINLTTATDEAAKKITIKDVPVTASTNLIIGANGGLTVENASLNMGANDLTVKYNGNLTVKKGEVISTGDVTIDGEASRVGGLKGASASIDADSSAITTYALTADNIIVKNGAKLTVNNANGNGVQATTKIELGGNAASVKAGTLEVSASNHPIASQNTAYALGANGTGVALDAYDSAITVKNGDIEFSTANLNGTSNLTADNSKIKGATALNVKDSAKVSAKDVTGTVVVNGRGAELAYYDETAAALTPTMGIVKQKGKNDNNVDTTFVFVEGIASYKVLKGETLVLASTNEDLEVTTEAGAIVDNQTSNAVKVKLNGKEKEFLSEEVFIANGSETPADPTDPTDPVDPSKPEDPNKPNTGDDQPNKNPQTFDGILSYVGVALSSVGGLGVSLKKRLFR